MSRLLHYDPGTTNISHRIFSDFPGLLRAGDVLVFNDAKVIPARFALRKITGGRVEGLFIDATSPGRWRVLLRDAGSGKQFHFANAPEISVTITNSLGEGQFDVEINTAESAVKLLERLGRMPLPPYIQREKDHDDRDHQDRENYQTVYARNVGSVAAPTAGLHFTDTVLQELEARGIQSIHVTLHVGMGTFKPVTAETLAAHNMHSERYEISEEAAAALNAAEQQNCRIVAIGTTAARVLESYPERLWQACIGETDILIYPPYRWKRVGALLTNFHLPRSTLIALVAAFVGIAEQRRIYREGIENRYRFFSYGDAMLLG